MCKAERSRNAADAVPVKRMTLESAFMHSHEREYNAWIKESPHKTTIPAILVMINV